mgnify:FL=1
MPIFQQDDGTWWCVWSGYTLGPYETQEAAEDMLADLRARMDCVNGSCDQ